jgi:hypothetical protein
MNYLDLDIGVQNSYLLGGDAKHLIAARMEAEDALPLHIELGHYLSLEVSVT